MEQLISTAAALARIAPGEWASFVKALEGLAGEAVTNFVSSDAAMLSTNQGRAQAYLLLHRTCGEAIKQQQEIERRKENG